MQEKRCLAAVVAAVVRWAAPAAHAMINPKFTPVQLVRNSALVLWVDLKPGESKDVYMATIRESLKGKPDQPTLRLDISTAGDDEAAASLREQLAAGKPALFFAGEFEDTKELGGGNTRRCAFLHLGGDWAVFEGGQEGRWRLTNIDDRMLMTVWHGGTEMLRRAIDDIQTDDDPVVPVAEGIAFSKGPARLASLTGAVRAVRTVDRGLQSKSVAFAWGDFAGQGRLDRQALSGRMERTARHQPGLLRPHRGGPCDAQMAPAGGHEQAKEVVLEKGGTLQVELK